MKKKSSGAKSRPPTSVDEYLARVPEPARGTLQRVRAVIRSAVPVEASEAISYGIPTFKYKGNLLAFGAFSRHCSLFPMSYGVIEKFESELKGLTVAKGTIRFPSDEPLPIGLLKKIVKARVADRKRRVRESERG